MTFFSWFTKDKALTIPGYKPLIENSIFVEDCSCTYYNHDALVITRYSLPEKEEVINYLQKKAKTVNRLRGEMINADINTKFRALHNNSLDIVLLSDFKLAKRLELMDEKTENKIKHFFPEEINSYFSESSVYNPIHFLACKKGIIRADDLEALKGLESKAISQDWNSYLSSEQWSMDIYYNFGLPKHSELMTALRNKTSHSKIVRTINIQKYQQDMEATVEPLYHYLKKYTTFWQWHNSSAQKLEQVSLKIVNDFSYDTFLQKQGQDYATMLSALLVKDDNTTLN